MPRVDDAFAQNCIDSEFGQRLLVGGFHCTDCVMTEDKEI